MLRIYLDWNVFSNLKRDEFAKLKQSLIDASKDMLIFYTPAHFSDLMKSADKGNPYFEQDLDTLTNFCGGHFVRWDVSKGMQAYHCLPRDFLPFAQEVLALIKEVTTSGNTSNDPPSIAGQKERTALRFQEQLLSADDHGTRELIKHAFPGIGDNPTFADMYEAVPAFIDKSFHDGSWYKNLRAKFQESGMKLEANAGNWKAEEVIEKIDAFLASNGAGIDFAGLQDQQETITGVKRSFYDKITSSYHMLDFLGYKADKLPKETDSMNNIAMDAEHAFYAAHADILVSNDKNLLLKAKVLYHYFKVDTLVVDPSNFHERLNTILAQAKFTPNLAGLNTIIRNAS